MVLKPLPRELNFVVSRFKSIVEFFMQNGVEDLSKQGAGFQAHGDEILAADGGLNVSKVVVII